MSVPAMFSDGTPTTLPSVCPVCGAYSLAPAGSGSALLAVCDVLVLKALEKLGNFLVRQLRGRHAELDDRPLYVGHTIWKPDDPMVDKALRGAWEVVPALLDVHGCCDVTSPQVIQMLDDYVHDLAVTGTAHTVEELQYRFTSRLGLPVYWHRELPDHVLIPRDPDVTLDPYQGLPSEAKTYDGRPTQLPVDGRVIAIEQVLSGEEEHPTSRVPSRIAGALRENGFRP